MSIVLVVDAACDLPKSFLDERGIKLFPISINVDGNIYTDDKDPQKLQEFYQKDLLTLEHDAESIPFSTDQMAQLMLDNIAPYHDFALVQTVSMRRSLIHANCTAAQPLILAELRKQKDAGQNDKHFGMRVMNSENLFTGQGMLAAFTSDLIIAGKSKQDVIRLAEAFKSRIYAYVIPPNVAYLRERARKRGETGLSALGAFVAKSLDITPILKAHGDETEPVAKVRGFDKAVDRLFEYAVRCINEGLLSPYVIVSIAGEVEALSSYNSFKQLQDVASKNNVTVIACTMGLTTGLNVGPGAISLGLAATDHDFS